MYAYLGLYTAQALLKKAMAKELRALHFGGYVFWVEKRLLAKLRGFWFPVS